MKQKTTKRALLATLVLFCTLGATAPTQESAVEIQKRVEELSARRETLRVELERVDADLAEAEQALNGLEVEEALESGGGLQITTISGTPLSKEPFSGAERLLLIPAGESVLLVDGAPGVGFYEAVYKGTHGFISHHWIPEDDPAVSKVLAHFDSRSKKQFKEEIQQLRDEREKEKAERIASLIKKFGKPDAERIIKRMVWIGMTAEQLRESWGPPEDINTTVTALSKREQWVYKRHYVYIIDGLVTSWQQ